MSFQHLNQRARTRATKEPRASARAAFPQEARRLLAHGYLGGRIAPWFGLGLALALGLGSPACTPGAGILESILNNTASLGRPTLNDDTEDDTPGLRADIKVQFVNNTPYRAVFTFGTYDPLNTVQGQGTSFPVKFQQFFVDDDTANRLDAFGESEVITFTAGPGDDPGGCGRAMGIGCEELIQLIDENRDLLGTSASGEEIRDEALRPVCDPQRNRPVAGIAFFRETGEGPGTDACDSADDMAAWASGFRTLQGAQYPCDSTLVYTFVEDSSADGGIRVDLRVEQEEDEEEEEEEE